MTQLDLYLRDRIQVMTTLKLRRSCHPAQPGFLDRQVVGDHAIGGCPAAQIEEPLAFHRELQPTLVPHGPSGKGLIGPRGSVLADLVYGPGSQQGVLGRGHVDQRQGDFVMPRT